MIFEFWVVGLFCTSSIDFYFIKVWIKIFALIAGVTDTPLHFAPNLSISFAFLVVSSLLREKVVYVSDLVMISVC